MGNEWNDRCEPRGALVHVHEGLEVGNVAEEKETLLEGILDAARFVEHLDEKPLQAFSSLERRVGGAAHGDACVADLPGGAGCDETVRQKIVQGADRLFVGG